MENTVVEEASNICLEVGRLMLSNGAETYRVEDTMFRIGKSMGLNNLDIFVVPTAIIMTITDANDKTHTEIIRVTERDTNLEIVMRANDLSRRLSNQPMSYNEARVELYRIRLENNEFKPWLVNIATAFMTGSFTLLFGGGIIDFLPAAIAGCVGRILHEYLSEETDVSFFAEMIASIFIALIAFIFVQLGLGASIDSIILGSVMPLVPGVAITNGLRDLMAGHLLSGISVLAKAFLTAAAIGIGIAVVLILI